MNKIKLLNEIIVQPEIKYHPNSDVDITYIEISKSDVNWLLRFFCNNLRKYKNTKDFTKEQIDEFKILEGSIERLVGSILNEDTIKVIRE